MLKKNKSLKKYKTEVEKSNNKNKKLSKYPVPSFDIGLNYLKIDTFSGKTIPTEKLNKYVNDWLKYPEKYLKLSGSSKVRRNKNFLEFPSILNKSQIVRFKYNPQQIGLPGRKVALIHLMHWNGRLKPYEQAINFIRKTGLPISTLIHVPAGRGLNPIEDDPVDYDMVSPNIGKTIFRARQDTQDIQFMAKYLKEELGYKQVGLFTYSIGSLRGILASMVNPGLFDFGIFQMVADDFTESVMGGVATRLIANKIDKKIDYKLLKRLWSTISLGAYEKKFSNLPKHTRIVQCEYDFVFGQENVKRFNKKIKKQRPDIEIDTVPLTHITFGKLPLSLKIMWDNLRFIYQHTEMKKCKRSKYFCFHCFPVNSSKRVQ